MHCSQFQYFGLCLLPEGPVYPQRREGVSVFIAPQSAVPAWSDNVPLSSPSPAVPVASLSSACPFRPLLLNQYAQGLNSGFMADMMNAQMLQTTLSMESTGAKPNAHLGFHSPFQSGTTMQCPKAHPCPYPGPPEPLWNTPHYNRPYPCPRPALPDAENGVSSLVLCLATKH